MAPNGKVAPRIRIYRVSYEPIIRLRTFSIDEKGRIDSVSAQLERADQEARNRAQGIGLRRGLARGPSGHVRADARRSAPVKTQGATGKVIRRRVAALAPIGTSARDSFFIESRLRRVTSS